MTSALDDTVAIVTGGSSGNGRAIAVAFAQEGADVVILDVRKNPRRKSQPTHELITSTTSAQASFVEGDVTVRDDLETAVDHATAYGNLNIMVNNAGLYSSKPTREVTEQEFDQVMAVNVKGTFFGAQVALEQMLTHDENSVILNMSSVAGMEGTGETVPYCTSKGAVRLMTYALADEFGPDGIRVNAIHPGIIETKMTIKDVPLVGSEMGDSFLESIPLGRFGQPTDVAAAAVFLASDSARYINGESLVLDGGMYNTS